MSQALPRPATTPCKVRLGLSDGTVVDGVLFLLSDPSRPTGFTSAESILDGPRQFLVIGQERGGSLLVSRDAIRTAEISASGPGIPELPDAGASLDVVTLHMDGGEEVSGVLRAVAREGFERMSDVINAGGRFITLGSGDQLILVSKKHVVRVSF